MDGLHCAFCTSHDYDGHSPWHEAEPYVCSSACVFVSKESEGFASSLPLSHVPRTSHVKRWALGEEFHGPAGVVMPGFTARGWRTNLHRRRGEMLIWGSWHSTTHCLAPTGGGGGEKAPDRRRADAARQRRKEYCRKSGRLSFQKACLNPHHRHERSTCRPTRRRGSLRRNQRASHPVSASLPALTTTTTTAPPSPQPPAQLSSVHRVPELPIDMSAPTHAPMP